MSPPNVLQPNDTDFGSRHHDRWLSAPAVCSAKESAVPYLGRTPPAQKNASDPVGRQTMLRPTLHHFALKTANLEVMVDWYAKVLGMAATSSSATAAEGGCKGRVVWIGNGAVDHCIALMSHPSLTDDVQRSRHKGLHHVAFELPTIDDLLATYARLKDLGIKPVLAADHGPTTSFYYEDPDHNSIELMVDNLGDYEQSSPFPRTSTAFSGNSAGTDVDPEQLTAARAAGMSIAELHERAYAGEYCSAKGFYRHCLVAAAKQKAVV